MSNYQRLISYIYTYESGLKGKNVGFAKLETRNSQCRLTVNVKKVVPVGSPLGVYLLSGDGEQRIGTLFSRNGAGEFRALLNADRVEGSGRPLQEFFGLSIHEAENAGHSYTTIWEDAAMNAAEAVKKEEKNADRSQEKLQSRQEEERADQAEEIGPESEAEEALEKQEKEAGRPEKEEQKPEAEKPEEEEQAGLFMQQVISIVEANLTNPDFSAKSLASLLNLSQPTLYRKMKQQSNLSIIEVIRSIRISKAASLIMQKKYSVQEVAEMVGYNDINTFRKHFTNQFGVSPSRYNAL